LKRRPPHVGKSKEEVAVTGKDARNLSDPNWT